MNTTKKAFTLAEVLITLTIIGVIASMTIPSLIQSTNDAELQAKWKRSFGTLSQAVNLLLADNGGNLASVYTGTTGATVQTALATKLNVIKTCAAAGNVIVSNCWHDSLTANAGGEDTWNTFDSSTATAPVITDATTSGMVLSDGTMILLVRQESDCTANAAIDTNADVCVGMYIDTNGLKKPNKVGKDIFFAAMAKDRLIPGGAPVYKNTTLDTLLSGTATDTGIELSATRLYSN